MEIYILFSIGIWFNHTKISAHLSGLSREVEPVRISLPPPLLSFPSIYLRLLYFKELVHATVGAGKSEIHRGRWQSGNSGRSGCNFESKIHMAGHEGWEPKQGFYVALLRPNPLFGKPQPLLLRHSTVRMGPTHIMGE